jgi:hypothetical protein
MHYIDALDNQIFSGHFLNDSAVLPKKVPVLQSYVMDYIDTT